MRRIGRYLLGRLKGENPNPFEAELLNSSRLQEQTEQQEITYEAIRWYGRRKVRREIKAAHRRMITERPNGRLAKKIRRIFSG